jgi:hypothetical protein
LPWRATPGPPPLADNPTSPDRTIGAATRAELDVEAGSEREVTKIGRVRGDDLAAVAGERRRPTWRSRFVTAATSRSSRSAATSAPASSTTVMRLPIARSSARLAGRTTIARARMARVASWISSSMITPSVSASGRRCCVRKHRC